MSGNSYFRKSAPHIWRREVEVTPVLKLYKIRIAKRNRSHPPCFHAFIGGETQNHALVLRPNNILSSPYLRAFCKESKFESFHGNNGALKVIGVEEQNLVELFFSNKIIFKYYLYLVSVFRRNTLVCRFQEIFQKYFSKVLNLLFLLLQ